MLRAIISVGAILPAIYSFGGGSNCVLTNAPILIDAIPFWEGTLGAEETHRIGAVLDRAALRRQTNL
jgi:hypothetical protein